MGKPSAADRVVRRIERRVNKVIDAALSDTLPRIQLASAVGFYWGHELATEIDKHCLAKADALRQHLQGSREMPLAQLIVAAELSIHSLRQELKIIVRKHAVRNLILDTEHLKSVEHGLDAKRPSLKPAKGPRP